ncbi:Two-component system response regulator [Fulvivirga imtechensis AK7]|uniref:Two-component system response regulator n=1 Tax=Fulvivirga imtechensis AK7 TaxID=1237149 RepID=L8JPS0_9BACT|nr:response regulator transcription factor [Fulvivirga imtechensis]ELR70198.1 Two-component system response regulator [Fulvivirga imtechensis AK7]
MKHILLVEDEPSVASFIKKGLEEEGYQVTLAYDSFSAIQLLSQIGTDLIILDIILPGENGIELCRKIKTHKYSSSPILILTALGSTENIVTGLDSGADDYLTKPFKLKELLARIRALLRRRDKFEMEENDTLGIADLTLDRNAKTAKRSGKPIKLTSTEYRLLEYFLRNKGKVLSRIDLLENVWDINFDLGTNVVDVYVNYLRNKIDKGFSSKLIHTVFGMGYTMKEE